MFILDIKYVLLATTKACMWLLACTFLFSTIFDYYCFSISSLHNYAAPSKPNTKHTRSKNAVIKLHF